ncbi:MAG: hypothetical protein QXX08_09075 [Candidatus Bathyarchaeia archaeon]
MQKVINAYYYKVMSISMTEKKERLSVEVDKEILRQFKQMVIRKHGKLRGNMSAEVTEALKISIEQFKGRD